jgi:hypothetical protein
MSMKEGHVSHLSFKIAKQGRLTTKTRSSADIVNVFGHTTCIDDRIDSRDGKGSTLTHDKEVISRKGGTESSELGDSDKEVVEHHFLGRSCSVIVMMIVTGPAS